MIYLEIADRIAKLPIFLEGGYYTISDLVDIIAEHADGSEDTSEESDTSDDDFENRVSPDLD